MMMTFVLTPRSHYNTITEPCTHFLFSLLKGLSIDFPSHMIVSMIYIYQDSATHDKLIFPSAITRILTHMHVLILSTPLFYIIGAISQGSMQRSATQLAYKAKQPCEESTLAQQEEADIQAAKDATHASRPFLHLLLILLLEQRNLSLPSWINFSLCMLILVVILIIFLMRYVR